MGKQLKINGYTINAAVRTLTCKLKNVDDAGIILNPYVG